MLGGCANLTGEHNTVQLTLAPDQTQHIVLGLDQTLIAEIRSNPTTGYRWEFDQLTRERRCYIVKEIPNEIKTDHSAQSMPIGAPSTQKWSIKIDPAFPCMQEQRIRLTYRRSWEPLSDQNASTLILLKPIINPPLMTK